jgi:hypothetical protein
MDGLSPAKRGRATASRNAVRLRRRQHIKQNERPRSLGGAETMRTCYFFLHLLACTLALLSTATPAQAEVYKWVDAQGRTHYTNKAEAAQDQSSTVKIAPNTPSQATQRSYWDYVTGKAQKTYQLKEQSNSPVADEEPAPVKKQYDGIDDAAKCDYARDVLNGKLKLRNGEATGDYERKTAEDDMRRYCH